MNNPEVQGIVDGLSRLIHQALTTAASEQRHPSGDADSSDNTIEVSQKQAINLRKIREDFENEITGVIW